MKKTILGVPAAGFAGVILCCLAGILAGSFFDYAISTILANKTSLGAVFATYGSYFSFCLYPAAGTCLYLGLKKKGDKNRMLANVLLVLSCFLAVYYSNTYSGASVRELLGYVPGTSSPLLSVQSWLLWVILFAWVPMVMRRVLDDEKPEKLIAVGAAILVAGVLSDQVNLWLKQVASRPRFKYLLTLEDPMSQFRAWWQMVPNLAGSNDSFKSWPSGNMSIAAMMFGLPMLTDVTKNHTVKRNWIAFALACAFVCLYAYNRIHMTNHFLSDVCSGTLISYLFHACLSRAFLKAAGEE